jgi:hypothetical protein
MKTITTLLMSSFLLAGTINTALAVDDTRSERTARPRNEIQVKRETTTERSREAHANTTRTTTERRTEVSMPANRRQTEIRLTTREIRREQNNRNEQPNREVRRETSDRNERPSADVRRNDDRPRVDNRITERRPDYNRRANLNYREHQQRCTFCSGRGFTLHIDGFRHIRCNHCEGHGYRVYREMYVDACPICYDPLHNGRLDCSLEDLAWMETNRIAFALELSDHQRNRVFDINYRYLSHRYQGDYYPTSRRDREIRRILRLGQIIAFAVLLDELREGELCYTCSNERD